MRTALNGPGNDGRAMRAGVACAALALGLGACGNLDNVTTAQDLRVLAVKAEPAGFLVPLDDPGSLKETTATVTALVVDPQKPDDILTVTGTACPDTIDTITAASGQATTLCAANGPATTELPPSTSTPVASSPVEYNPKVVYGLTPAQLALLFSPTATMNPILDQAVQYNRDFSFDARVNLTFTLGTESASALKRIVYWPLLPPALAQAAPARDGVSCPAAQVPNTNPTLTDLGLFRKRVDGIPMDPIDSGLVPTLSIAKDELYAQPAFDAASAEHYLLRVKDAETGQIATECRHELLTFQFFATAGTFEPVERMSELSPLFAPPDDGHIPIDSRYKPPAADALPPDGVVTIWIVARDERAGAAWVSRTFKLTP